MKRFYKIGSQGPRRSGYKMEHPFDWKFIIFKLDSQIKWTCIGWEPNFEDII